MQKILVTEIPERPFQRRKQRKAERERGRETSDMATNNNNGGEAKGERRRRIAERGSDRMALITGRIQSLPPTAPPSSAASSTTHPHLPPPRHGRPQSLSASFDYPSDDTDNNPPPRHMRPQSLSSSAFSVDYNVDQSGGAEDKHDASSSSTRLKHQAGFRYSKFDNFEPLTQDSDDTISEANHQVPVNGSGKIKPSPVTSRDQNAEFDTKKLPKPCRHKHTFFSSRELNSCIIASETTRALSSLIIALLVVFFYMISESIVVLRPLYIVLLTDITIVVARLYHEKARVSEEAEGERFEAHGDRQNWGDAVKLLERGLVFYQAIRGVFIDCSIYVVVVVCGTSLM